MRSVWGTFVLSCLALQAGEGLPAFPGAEGFGAGTPGGRGGRVLLVTTTNDSGPGSLRAAIEAQGPRIVVFRVGGLLDLKSPLRVREPFLTLAGQSAPGDGICLRGYPLEIYTHDVVVRYMRSRPGDISGKELDSLTVGGDSRNVVIDHCSTTWSTDENLSPTGGIAEVTVQWCLIAEALNRSVHKKGAHGYGSLVRAVGGLTLHHNLWAHNTARNPRLGDNYGKPPYPTFDVRNNVIYDYGGMCSGMTGDILNANYADNHIRPGPDSNRKRAPIVLTTTANVKYFLAGNVIEGNPELTRDNSGMIEPAEAGGRKLYTLVHVPFPAPRVTATPAADLFETVLTQAGAVLPRRDAVDARIVGQARRGTGRIIDSQKDVGGWPEYRNASAPVDSDGDGMPDAWETSRGLNPRDASDAAKDRDGDGYTNIEEYLNELAGAKGKQTARPARH